MYRKLLRNNYNETKYFIYFFHFRHCDQWSTDNNWWYFWLRTLGEVILVCFLTISFGIGLCKRPWYTKQDYGNAHHSIIISYVPSNKHFKLCDNRFGQISLSLLNNSVVFFNQSWALRYICLLKVTDAWV